MNKSFVIAVFLSLFLSVAAESNQYQVLGLTLKKLNGKQIMLLHFKGEEVYKVDTTIIKNGKFLFQGRADSVHFAMIACGNYPERVLSARLMLETGNITVQLGVPSEVGGTLLNEVYQNYLKVYTTYEDSLNLLSRPAQYDSIQQIDVNKRYLKNWEVSSQIEQDFIKKNLNNPLGITLLKEAFMHINIDVFKAMVGAGDSILLRDPDIKYLIAWIADQDEKERLRQESQNTANQ